MSGNRAAFNQFGNASAFSGTLFDLASLSLGAAFNDGLNVQIEGLYNGNSVYTRLVIANPFAAQQVNLGWTGINELRFSSFGGTDVIANGSGTQFVLDNLQLGSLSVPEPATIALLAVGLVGVAVVRRRQRA